MLNKKYRVLVEIRSNKYQDSLDCEGDKVGEYLQKKSFFESDTMDHLDQALKWANGLLGNNKWLEDGSFYINASLCENFKTIPFRLKNGIEVYVSVEKVFILNRTEMEKELRRLQPNT